MNAEFKPKLLELRSSGEKIAKQDTSVNSKEIDDVLDSSQKHLEDLQSALHLRKLRFPVVHCSVTNL